MAAAHSLSLSPALQIEHTDSKLGFKLKGYVTNANYSTKRATFLLFINNRSVNSSSIKRALDEGWWFLFCLVLFSSQISYPRPPVYAAYLPKGAHYFGYLSLEVPPENVDVNVHPTKSEVHLLGEDAIVEAIQQAVAEKLLGGNASRTFYTQVSRDGEGDGDGDGDG